MSNIFTMACQGGVAFVFVTWGRGAEIEGHQRRGIAMESALLCCHTIVSARARPAHRKRYGRAIGYESLRNSSLREQADEVTGFVFRYGMWTVSSSARAVLFSSLFLYE
jgi:hypothetical protein